MTAQEQLDRAYNQRNFLAIAFVKMALKLGWPAGRGIDGKFDNDMEWRHVVYVDMPCGEQVSFHMAPAEVELLDGLPCYRGEWDGKYTGTQSYWPKLLDEAGESRGAFALTGFALKRWEIERSKLEADPDVSPEVRRQILDGYAKSWAKP